MGDLMDRRGRDFYAQHYKKVIDLWKQGASVKDISKNLGLSYSCTYHWVKGLRKPEKGNLVEFENFIKNKGPVAVAELEDRFPKHNELFLTGSRRGFPLKRHKINRKLGSYSTWYFIDGQEKVLKKRLTELFEKVEEIKGRLF